MDGSELVIMVGLVSLGTLAITAAFAKRIWREVQRQSAREALLRERIALVRRGLDPVTHQPLSGAGAETAPIR